MLKFFRKIRQKLIAENNLSKYLLYAMGEIILVVIGILIALSVNTWNESRKQKNAEKEFIVSIKKDLKHDLEYIQLVISLADKKDSLYRIISDDISGMYNSDRPLLDSMLQQYFVSQRTFYPVYGAYQASISGNAITKFRNKGFSTAVTTLYNSTYARLTDNGEDVDARWYYVVKKYSEIRRTGHIPDMNQTELNDFLNDVYYHIYGLNHYTTNLKSAVDEIDVLLSEY